jgi:hypothetical protein
VVPHQRHSVQAHADSAFQLTVAVRSSACADLPALIWMR